MSMTLRLAAFLGVAAVLLLGGLRVGAQGGRQTFCVDRPVSFGPLFKPSGCFTYKPIDGGVVVVGHALLGADFLTPGGTVEARVNDTSCGSTTVRASAGVFVLPVAGGDSQSGCAAAGDRVDFYMDGELASQTLTWPGTPGPNPRFMSLSSVTGVAWYWFERPGAPTERVGTPVQAFSNGTLCGETTIGGQDAALGPPNRPDLRGFLKLIVSTAKDGCGQEGTLVEFRVGGLPAETAVPWRPGVQRLDLQVQADADCSFSIDSRDASLIQQYAAALVTSTPCSADANRDDRVDALDAQRVLQYAAGLTSLLPD